MAIFNSYFDITRGYFPSPQCTQAREASEDRRCRVGGRTPPEPTVSCGAETAQGDGGFSWPIRPRFSNEDTMGMS